MFIRLSENGLDLTPTQMEQWGRGVKQDATPDKIRYRYQSGVRNGGLMKSRMKQPRQKRTMQRHTLNG